MDTSNTEMDSKPSGTTKDQLISDFKVVLADVEALIKATAHTDSESISSLRTRAEESLATAKSKITHAQDTLGENGKVAAEAVEAYVQSNTWEALSIAAGFGLVMGLLISRRKNK